MRPCWSTAPERAGQRGLSGAEPERADPGSGDAQGPIFETAAILLWLADTHGQLGPAPDSPDRAAFLKWLFFASNTLHADLRILFYAEKYIDRCRPRPCAPASAQGCAAPETCWMPRPQKAPDWLSADQPSVLTYYVACMMRWMALYPASADRSWYQLADTPYLQKILMQLESRPATRAAIAAEGLGVTPFTSPTYANPPEGSAT